VPLYLLVYKLHLYDTLFALMLTMSAAAVPLSVLVMVSFVRDIPRELISAMLVDGGTEWTVFRRLIVAFHAGAGHAEHLQRFERGTTSSCPSSSPRATAWPCCRSA
jgi:ABC-type maltose transport system permease subunit